MKRIFAALALFAVLCSSAMAGTPLSPFSYSSGNPSSPYSSRYLSVLGGGFGKGVGDYDRIPAFVSQRDSASPVFTWSSTALSGSTAINAVVSGVVDTTHFAYSAYAPVKRGSAYPQYNMIEDKGKTPYVMPFHTIFNYEGNKFDLVKYGSGSGFTLWIDDKYIGQFRPYTQTGTAQAGTTTSITLASGASSTNGIYNQFTAHIDSGTGAGQNCLIASYVGSTKVATCSNTLGTAPDSTSVYHVTDDENGYWVNGIDGSIWNLNIDFGIKRQVHKIDVYGSDFYGVNIGAYDSVTPASRESALPVVLVGDSFVEGSGGPFNQNANEQVSLARFAGWKDFNDGEGSTGWCAPATSLNRLNFQDRIAPPAESWYYTLLGASAGTFTISVTYGGSTQTTSAIAYNATPATVAAAVQALSNVPASSVSFGGSGQPSYQPTFIVIHNASGATLSVDATGLTGATLVLNTWQGMIAPRVPKDGYGNALPFILFVQGSGNDASGSFTAANVQTCATYTAKEIVRRFPTAIPIFTGVVTASGATIASGDVAYNAAILAAAQYLPKINGNVPFIDTYAAGVGAKKWLACQSTVASPTSGYNDILCSVSASGHPTGQGHYYLAAKMFSAIKALFGAQ